MRSLTSARPVLATVAAAMTIGLGASPALAATTWTIKPGGAITGVAGKTVLKDTNTGTVLTCLSSAVSGALKAGSGLSGTGIGSINGGSFNRCGGPLGIVITVQLLDLPWRINFKSLKAGVITGTISHMELSAALSGCSFVIDGTRGGASDGMVNFTWNLGTGKLKISGGNLHIYNVMGCFGLVNTGDTAIITGTYAITPKQVISSP